MKVKLYPTLAVIAVVVITLIFACRKSDTVKAFPENFDVAVAKEWWYGTYRKLPAYKQVNTKSIFAPTESGENARLKYPSWKRGIPYTAGDLQIVEMPLFYNNRVIVFPGSYRYSETEKKRVAAASLQKLVMVKNQMEK